MWVKEFACSVPERTSVMAKEPWQPASSRKQRGHAFSCEHGAEKSNSNVEQGSKCKTHLQ